MNPRPPDALLHPSARRPTWQLRRPTDAVGTEPAALRVAHVMIGFRSDGGAEHVVRTLLEEVRDLPVDTTVITLARGAKGSAEELRRLDAELLPRPARRLVDPTRFAQLVRTLRRGHFDVVHTHLSAANILGVTAARLAGIPSVVSLHNTHSSADDHWYHGRLERLVLRRFANVVLAVGEETAVVQGPRLSRSDIAVLPNAVTPAVPIQDAARQELRRAIMSEPDRRLILTVGRMEPQKAHHELVEAFRCLSSRRPDTELAIVGRGSLRDATEELVAQLGLADRVHFLGVRDDVRELMQASDVFALSSHWEGLPMVLLEAMASRVPVVATDVGDVAVVLAGTQGRVVPPGEPGSLASALAETIDDLDRGVDLTSASADTVEQRYSSRAWADELLGIYRTVSA